MREAWKHVKALQFWGEPVVGQGLRIEGCDFKIQMTRPFPLVPTL